MNYQKQLLSQMSKFSDRCKEYITDTVSDIKKGYADAYDEHNAVAAVLAAGRIIAASICPILCLTASLLLSSCRITFGIYPMGQAFLAAAGRYTLWAYSGAVIGAIFTSHSLAVDIAVYTLTLCLRRLTAIFIDSSHRLFDFEDNLRVKMSVSVIGAAVLGAYHAIIEKFSLQSLAAFLLYVALCPVLTFLYSAVISKQRADATVLYREAGTAAVAISIMISLRGITIIGFDISVAVALLLTVIATRRYGIYKGVIFGLFAGLSVPSALMPIYAVAAVTSGVLFPTSSYIASAASTLAAVSWTVYAGGYLMAADTVPSLFLGGALLAVTVYSGALSKKEDDSAEDDIPHEAALFAERLRREETEALLSSESKAFSNLSDMLFRLSDRLRRPSFFDVKEVAADGRSKVCRRCRNRDVCYTEREDEAADAWAKITARIFEKGTITEEDMPDYITEVCSHTSELCDSINEAYADKLKSLIDTDKTEIMAFDYSAISAVLSDLLLERQNEYEINDALSRKLSSRLRENKITAKRVCVFGNRQKTIYISDIKLSELHVGEDDLRKLANEACGGEFTSPEFEIKGSEVNATLRSAKTFSVKFEKRQTTKDESSACGDSALGFSCRKDRYCAIISDGMGSGREAALTSGMCVLFIEKMMSAGNSAAVTLKMLNSMIRAKGAECSSTVDLLDFDLLTGHARFIKSGAAPSFIVRGNEVYKINSKTVPVGIIRSLDAEQTTVKTQVGDIIVMVSDGIAEDDADAAWLYSLLTDITDRRAADTADIIIEEAERRLKKKDDATVCVIRVAPPSKNDDSI